MSAVLEKMNELPEGWAISPLSDCAEILDSKRIPINSKERSARIDGKSQDELYPYYGATGQVGVIDGFIFEGEYLLIGEDGAPFFDKSKNVAYIAKGKFWVNNHAHILDAIEGVTSNKYLLHYLNKFNYKDYVGGTTRLKLNQADLKQIPVPLAPPEQQKRIVAKIEELFSHIDAGIEALKKAKQLLKQYRQSVLKAAVTGELTKEWREANKAKLEPASQLLERILKERRQKWEEQQLEQFKAKGKMPKDDKWKGKYIEPVLPEDLELPSEWITASLDQLTEYITSGSRGWAKYYADSGATFIRAQNLKYDVLDLDSIAYVSLPDKAEGMRTRVKYGDLLITITGANVTKTGCVNIELDEAYVSQHVALCRPTITKCVRYLYTYLISKDGARKKLEEAAYGAGKPGLNLDNLKTLRIAFPSIEEQEEIVRLVEQRLVAIQRLDDDLGVQLRKAEKNKQSVLASVFKGSLNGI
ncbi:MAG: restriction endonuclease subunit S [Gammaproteobacteria bacterium]|nr:restriction endonuclease subunit S [Gammaproteobacteria bacterium]